MKPILFTHNDLDGASCAIIAKLFFPNIEIHTCSYDNIADNIKKHLSVSSRRTVIISDISYKQDMDDITDLLLKHDVIIADHHSSSIWLQYMFPKTNLEESKNKCGAILLYEILSYVNTYKDEKEITSKKIKKFAYYKKLKHVNNKLYTFLTLVNEWDLWLWSTSNKDELFNNPSLRLNNAYYLLDFKFITKAYNYLIGKRKKLFSYIDEKNITEYCNKQKDDILSYIDNKKTAIYHSKTYGDLKCCLVEMSNSYQSITSSYILASPSYNENYDITVLTYEESGSLRNPKDGINLCTIAMELGGGGHPYAAGFNWKENKDKFIIK